MKRILLLATVAVMLAMMMAVTVGPASATIHSLSCADEAEGHPAVETQNPPGITEDDESEFDHNNGSNADDRQPIDSLTEDAPDQSQGNENARVKKVDRCSG